MATPPRRHYNTRRATSQDPGQTSVAFTAVARTHGLPFEAVAGTPPPRREIARPRQARKPLPAQVEAQLTMTLFDREGATVGDSAIKSDREDVNPDEDDSSSTGPSSSPTPVKPKPSGPRPSKATPATSAESPNPIATDVGGAYAPPVSPSPQMFDWPTFPSQDMGGYHIGAT